MGGFGRDPIPGFTPSAAPSTPVFRPETAVLRVMNGPGAGCLFPLDRLLLLVGRSDPPAIVVDIDLAECELSLPPKVSRRHAELQWVDGELQITDIGSSNGTWVDDNRLVSADGGPLSAPARLTPGSRIRFANVACEIALNAYPPSS